MYRRLSSELVFKTVQWQDGFSTFRPLLFGRCTYNGKKGRTIAEKSWFIEDFFELEVNVGRAKNLGIALDENIDLSRIEASLIGHILLADVSSSQ